MASALDAGVVVDKLGEAGTARLEILAALEAHSASLPEAVVHAAAPALVDLVMLGATEARDAHDRAGLILARIFGEALRRGIEGHAAMCRAAFRDGRLARLLQTKGGSIYTEIMNKPVEDLTYADAHSCACYWAWYIPWVARGFTLILPPSGFEIMAYFKLWHASLKVSSSEETPRRLIELLLELMRAKSGTFGDAGEELMGGGLAFICIGCLIPWPSLGSMAVDCGIFEATAGHLSTLDSPADELSVGNFCGAIMSCMTYVFKCFSGKSERPDLQAFIAAGLFDRCLKVVTSFAAAGVASLDDTSAILVYASLAYLRNCRAEPGCESKIRSIAPALGFCLENDLTDLGLEVGLTTQAVAAALCCGVFGRDDERSDFCFTQHHIDILLKRWSQVVRGEGFSRATKPTADAIMVVELCVSDLNKPLLLSNACFLPYLIDALLLDPAHPRAELPAEIKEWCQTTHAGTSNAHQQQ